MTGTRVAVVGAGHLGRLHAMALSRCDRVQGAELVAIVDPCRQAGESVAQQCGARYAPCISDVFDSMDAAVIAAPSSSHHDIACELLEAGIDLFIEKPIATTAFQARDIHDRTVRNRAIVQVGHIERFNPAYRAALPFVSAPRYIECRRLGSYSFRSMDTGVVLDLMIHDIDLVLDMVGLPVTRVDAVTSTVVGPYEDIANVQLEFTNGCQAHLSASRVHSHAERTCLVHGDGFSLQMDFAARKLESFEVSKQLETGELNLQPRSAEEAKSMREAFFENVFVRRQIDVAACDPISEELTAFLRAVRTRDEPIVSARDGMRAVTLAERIVHAASRTAMPEWNRSVRAA